MKTSLIEFKDNYLSSLIQLHWRHWSALGIASHMQAEETWVVDLEALIISTFTNAGQDKRLYSACLEWLTKNTGWINSSRLKKIALTYAGSSVSSKKLLSLGELKSADLVLRQFGVRLLETKEPSRQEYDSEMTGERQKAYDTFQPRGIVTKPELKKSALLQLKLRGLLGRSARADVFLFLLYNDNGNSNSIAKEIYYDQKNVYTILEKWVYTGVVTKIAGDRKSSYSLSNKAEWLKLLAVKPKPRRLNWVSAFLVFDKISKALTDSQYSQNEYLLSSFFRDILNETKKVAITFDTQLPEPGEYPGEEYFEPFATSILGLMGKLVSSK